jgi:hypothetical protein
MCVARALQILHTSQANRDSLGVKDNCSAD